MVKNSFVRLLYRLLTEGYSDAIICNLNGTLPIRLLVGASKPLGWLLPFKNRSALFFFFPYFHVGGAEKVHADIVACFFDHKPWVFFTKRSTSRAFRPLFGSEARLLNGWWLCKLFYPVSVGVVAGFINRHRRPVVFGSNCLFFALLVPYLKNEARCVDLIHAFGGGAEDFMVEVAPRLDARVVINRKTLEDLKKQYAGFGLSPALVERINLIVNATEIPGHCPPKPITGEISVLYVGRGSEEKRVHIIGRVARLCRERGVKARFVFAGEVSGAVRPDDREYCEFAGEVTDATALETLYRQAHVLIIASSREGFPMTVMEGMAKGVVPLCTAVGGIPEHVRHGATGLLVHSSGEEEIAIALADHLARLERDRRLLDGLSRRAHAYAQAHFSRDDFCAAYKRLLLV